MSAELAELQGKKAAQEGEVGARLRALRAAALEVIAYFVERYDTHQASFAGELLRNTRGAGIVAPEELAAWREESMRGWYALLDRLERILRPLAQVGALDGILETSAQILHRLRRREAEEPKIALCCRRLA